MKGGETYVPTLLGAQQECVADGSPWFDLAAKQKNICAWRSLLKTPRHQAIDFELAYDILISLDTGSILRLLCVIRLTFSHVLEMAESSFSNIALSSTDSGSWLICCLSCFYPNWAFHLLSMTCRQVSWDQVGVNKMGFLPFFYNFF
jgi:hypothetical protein